ncbi:Cdc42 effector protein 5 [Camelus dromedarius]|uniref:Cdc42 effector protein 5 n=1 Tax=Camelus dromedarius TaxID=9838 RepID=A0A5N4DRB2_CAMDR|nr:Cdc42 effector protein 5 [Camelus dromedarius]
MPVLKQLGPAQPKKRPERGALSISAPLGDFRHTLHPPLPALPAPAPADPLLSFHLDLGPSMLDAVLGVMDAERPGAAAAKPDVDPGSGAQHPRARCCPNADLELDDVIGL